jgi:16S rRNA (adenine1518-N6/adenine1519-N6)-dimethyltransferase
VNASELGPLLQRLGVHPSRKLGQNFLVDGNTLRLIVQATAPTPGELLIEVGPGTGTLTAALLAAGAEVIAIELDARLAAHLAETLGQQPRCRLLHADACRVDYDELTGGRPWAVAANLPYAVSSVVLSRWLAAANRPTRLCLLLQLEMAERLAAAPRTKAYGGLSVRTQAQYQVQLARRVPPTVFFPPPEVDSALVLLTPAAGPAWSPAQWQAFGELVKTAFAQRRKMLAKLLRAHYPADRVAAALAAVGADPQARAEELAVPQYLALCTALTAPAP